VRRGDAVDDSRDPVVERRGHLSSRRDGSRRPAPRTARQLPLGGTGTPGSGPARARLPLSGAPRWSGTPDARRPLSSHAT